MKTRQQIINKAKYLRHECQQIFIDVEYWNANVRKAHESPIEPDPKGELKRIIDACDKLLTSEIDRCEQK